MATTAIDRSRLEAFMGQAVVDMGAAFSAPLVRLGARLGLYRALADGGPATPDELAERSGTEPRMVREWLGNQAAGGYVTYDAATGTYTLPPEQRVALADDQSEVLTARCVRHPGVVLCRRGPPCGGVPQRHGPALERSRPSSLRRHGRFFRRWLPSAPGGRLAPRARGRRREAGGGGARGGRRLRPWRLDDHHGRGLPGFDICGLRHPCGRDRARPRSGGRGGRLGADAVRGGGRGRVPGADGDDLVCVFDTFDDLGDPAAAARHIRGSLASDGTLMLVEPQVGERTEDNPTRSGVSSMPAPRRSVSYAIADGGPGTPALGNRPRRRRWRTACGGGLLLRPPRSRDAVQSRAGGATVTESSARASRLGEAEPVSRFGCLS